jgi:hypothetical protein
MHRHFGRAFSVVSAKIVDSRIPSEEDFMKSTTKMKKIAVRRTGDVRLTSATCETVYPAAN